MSCLVYPCLCKICTVDLLLPLLLLLLLLMFLQGYEPGFPLLLPTEISQQRSNDVLQYLRDGNYLDSRSKGLTAELVVYNADLRVLGHVALKLDWQPNGAIQGEGHVACSDFSSATKSLCNDNNWLSSHH